MFLLSHFFPAKYSPHTFRSCFGQVSRNFHHFCSKTLWIFTSFGNPCYMLNMLWVNLSSQIVYTVFVCAQVADVRKYQQWDHYGRGSSCIIRRTTSDESQFATSIVELHFLHLLHCYINSSSYICYIVQSTLSDYPRITYSTAMASTMQWTLAKYSVSDLSTKCQRKTYILENVSLLHI